MIFSVSSEDSKGGSDGNLSDLPPKQCDVSKNAEKPLPIDDSRIDKKNDGISRTDTVPQISSNAIISAVSDAKVAKTAKKTSFKGDEPKPSSDTIIEVHAVDIISPNHSSKEAVAKQMETIDDPSNILQEDVNKICNESGKNMDTKKTALKPGSEEMDNSICDARKDASNEAHTQNVEEKPQSSVKAVAKRRRANKNACLYCSYL